jgi:S1-C subfamily serine protease
MASPRFLTKTDLAGLVPLQADGAPAISQAARLGDLLSARLGPEAASLFAEPVATPDAARGGGSVSWYAPASGEPVPLAALPEARRALLTAGLRDRLAALAPLMGDPQAGPLLRAALILPGPDQVLALDDTVVLAGWGVAPRDLAADAPARAAHAARVFGAAWPAPLAAAMAGQGAPPAPPPPAVPAAMPAATPPPPPGPVAPPPPPPRGPVAAAPPPPPPRGPVAAAPPPPPPRGPVAAAPPPPPPRGPVAAAPPAAAGPVASVWNGWLVPLAVLVAIIFLILGFWLGWRLISERMSQTVLVAEIADEARVREQIRMQEDTNRALEREVADARAALARDVCVAEAGPLPALPPPARLPVAPGAVPPALPAPAPDAPPPAPGTAPPPGAAQPFQGTLLELLDRATVLVIGPQQQGGVGIGSGFVVAPGVIVTNAHVIQNLIPDRIHVVNRALQRPVRVTLGPRTAQAQPGAPDFAILRLPEGTTGLQPLALTRVAGRLDPVVAAGYPASMMQTDANFRALLEGGATAPELVVTDGLISAVQTLPSGLVAMPHTAAIGRGNSGGPLVDRCGRVVGMNTFGFVDPTQAERVSYAQKTDALLAFLAANGITPAIAEGPCRPAAAIPAQQPAPGGAAPAVPGGAGPAGPGDTAPATPGGPAPQAPAGTAPLAPGGTAPATPGGATPGGTAPATPAPPAVIGPSGGAPPSLLPPGMPMPPLGLPAAPAQPAR